MSKKLTTEEFIEKAKKIHGNKYDYSEVEYVNSHTKVKIYCKKCKNYFFINPNHHISSKTGCKKCAIEEQHLKQRLSKDEIIKRAKEIHGNKYEILEISFLPKNNKIKLLCKQCNRVFWQQIKSHLRGNGCKYCGYKANSEKHMRSLSDFIQKVKTKYGDLYDYSYIKKEDLNNKILIKCNTCNNFFRITPSNFLSNRGCSFCKKSKGEKQIVIFLKNNNINFIEQKKFKDCCSIRPLPFDFYLPNYNICIEFQGGQHYEKFRFEKDDTALLKRKERDQIKREYCKSHNIELIEIRYDEDVDLRLTELLARLQKDNKHE